MAMLNPPHPGLSVKHDCIEPLGLTVTRAAEVPGRHPADAERSHSLPAGHLARNGDPP